MNADTRPAASLPGGWKVAAATAAAYAATGWLALLLAVPPGYASPLYPSAGIALAAALVYGRAALLGAAIGAFAVNAGLSAARGQVDLVLALALPAAIGAGAALQAALGAWLVQRFVAAPLALAEPRDIGRFGLLGALVACLLNASLSSTLLWGAGVVQTDQLAQTAWTWWIGDSLGVLIGAPLVLTLIGRPREAWAPRRLTVGVPLLLATLLLALASVLVGRWDHQRMAATFERDAAALAAAAEARLQGPLDALQALRSAHDARGSLDEASLQAAARWWLAQPMSLQAMGLSVRVPRGEITAFEAQARAAGWPAYRVFDREGAIAGNDDEVVAIRLIEPREGNVAALGVNALSIPAARLAILRTRDSGEPAATAGFRLTQAVGDETGAVLYQALGRGDAFRGVVFVTLRGERTLAGLAGAGREYLQWCLVDLDPGSPRPRLAGPVGCERSDARELQTRRALAFAGRDWELRVAANLREVPGFEQSNAWLFSVIGMLSAALLGALLLMVSGRTRRIESAVAERTAELSLEVAERRSAEEALRDSEARLRSILDHVPIGVMFLDMRGRVVESNPHLCSMLQREPGALRGLTLSDLSIAEEEPENLRQSGELLSGAVRVAERQLRLRAADGRVFRARFRVTVLRDGQGQPHRLVAVVEDITEHLRLEEAERARDKAEAANRTKSEFLSRMSHELRTPLNAMIGFAQLLALEREPALSPRQHEWTEQIQRAGWHLLEMINETLDLARIDSGQVELALRPVALQPVLDQSVAMLAGAAAARGVQVEVALAADAGRVQADETRLTQVVTNLLSNAVKYNREGGHVSVSSRRDAGAVVLDVRDTGIGLSASQMGSLFQPYNRLGRERSGIEGTGIGLVISLRLAELMGGTLQATSTEGQGTLFTLRLPAAADADAALAEAAPEAASSSAPYRRRLVHYIEDNETNVEVMRGILAQRPQIELGVSMLGLDGLAAVRRRRPDLILLDMHLPDISGLELLRFLKDDDAVGGIPVLVVSADATTARMEQALTLGAEQYITKPVDIAGFLQAVDDVLERADTRWG